MKLTIFPNDAQLERLHEIFSEMYVLDTDVLSTTNTESDFNASEVEAWRQWVDNQRGLHLYVVTIMEVRYGIEKSRAKGATKKADRLAKWLASAETLHRG